jgi:hypothetical protein
MQVVSSGFNEAPGTPVATLMQIASVPTSATRPGLAGPRNLSPHIQWWFRGGDACKLNLTGARLLQ